MLFASVQLAALDKLWNGHLRTAGNSQQSAWLLFVPEAGGGRNFFIFFIFFEIIRIPITLHCV